MEAGKPNVPETIYHLSHPQSRGLLLYRYLTPRFWFTKLGSICRICRRKFEVGDYIYACGGRCSDIWCDFTVDIACSSIKGVVDFRGHKHMLFFLERVNPSPPLKCKSCNECTGELMFRCIDASCDFSLHLSCGPLPIAIPSNQRGHDLTLTLKDAFIDGFDPEDCWCDICEEQRDPMKCVYRSEDPPFTATIDCLLPEIVGALRGDLGEVKLRSVRKHILGVVRVTAQGSTKQELGEEVSTLDGDAEEVIVGEEFIVFPGNSMRDSMPREDRQFMVRAWTEIKKRLIEADIERNCYRYSDPAFEQFKELSITGADKFSALALTRLGEEEPRLVKVGDNLVPPELVPIYHHLIDKYGDFTADSPLGPIGKAMTLVTFLTAIQETMGLQICEVRGVLLVMLQFMLGSINENFGFDVQFALDGLEKLARACYALKFVKVRDNITADLTQQIEQLEREIPGDKPKIEALKEQYGRAKESAFMKQCLAEASTLKWKSAGEFLGM